jgi:CHASE2 domain-containing sensor protein
MGCEGWWFDGMELLYSLGMSLLLTLVLELCIGYLYGIREKKDFVLLALVNILTNPLVVMSYYLVVHYSHINRIAIVIVLELSAILTEGYYYRTYGKTFSHPMLFALCANLFSFSIGQLLNTLL